MLLTAFLRFTLLLLLLCTLLCALVPVFGGRSLSENEAWQSFGFTVCDLPCFVGITPGKTPFDIMPDLLHRSIPLIGNRMFYAYTAINFWASLPHTELSGWARNNQGVVGELRLTAPLALDHLIAQLGTPDCVLAGAQRATVLFWLRKTVSIGAVLEVDQADFNPNSPISALSLRSSETDACATSGALAWHGFAFIADYAH